MEDPWHVPELRQPAEHRERSTYIGVVQGRQATIAAVRDISGFRPTKTPPRGIFCKRQHYASLVITRMPNLWDMVDHVAISSSFFVC